ncbi:hypothetical protein CEE45_13470 [Candidatus Heimdallarchaeota archaeon B3_Heim]|nr:MAG: hypothetical protein CEE45_13470 [Candidatus Heimdallarchaeota archaeon B3_Heim]
MSWVDELINSPLLIYATAIALIIVVVVMLYGNRKNRQRMKELWAVLVKSIKIYGDKVGHSGGYRRLKISVSTDPKDWKLEKVEFMVILEDRDNAFHYVLKLFRPDYDKLLIQGSFGNKVHGKVKKSELEIISVTDKRTQKRLAKRLSSLSSYNLDVLPEDRFIVRTNNGKLMAQSIKSLSSELADHLIRISIGPDNPHIFTLWRLEEPDLITNMVNFVFSFTNTFVDKS